VTFFLQQVVNAAIVSGFYGLLAVAYVLMHGITGRVNLAFGALAIWSGSLTISFTLMFMLDRPGQIIVPMVLALAIALLNTTALGFAIERIAIRPLLKTSSLAMLVTTLGIAIVLEEAMRLMNNSRELWLMPVFNQPILSSDSDGFAVQINPIQLIVFGACVALASLLIWFIARHPFGRTWRAVAQDPLMASLCGVDPGRALMLTFLIASTLTAMAGAMLAVYYGSVSFYSGLIIGLKTLFVAVVGGLNSVTGAFVGAILLGVLETFWSAYAATEYRDVASFALLTGLMIFFPSGLFANGLQERGP
jgi:branched-chain amino acid transport system permease protein